MGMRLGYEAGREMMLFLQVKDVLDAHGLGYPSLSVLKANQDLYRALLVQPAAEILVARDEIRNFDRDKAVALFDGVIRLASENDVQLLITPEYSVPWDVIKKVCKEGLSPPPGTLWILGCESLTITELPSIKTEFEPWSVIFEDGLDAGEFEPVTAKYLNPLIYVFRTSLKDGGGERVVMLVQFKTYPSGDPDNTEVASMAKGKNVYVFEGGRNEIRLISLICSDALNFKDEEIDQLYEDTLLVHIQLNDKPRDVSYSSYRRRMCRTRCDRTEVICLNWAENLKFRMDGGDREVQKENIAASTWHTRTDQADTGDIAVEGNHRLGLYYTRDDREKRHMLNFSYRPAAFLVEASKVKHVGVLAGVSYRRGPKLTGVYHWDDGGHVWNEAGGEVGDGFLESVAGYKAAAVDLASLYAKSSLAVERVAAISHGSFYARGDWYAAGNLSTARVGGDEVVIRITTTQDPDGMPSRRAHLSSIEALLSLQGAIEFKPQLKDLGGGYRLSWSQASPSCNVESIGGASEPATLIFAGAGRTEDELEGLYMKAADLASRGSKKDRFAVVYFDGAVPKVFSPKVTNSIDGTGISGKNFLEPWA